LKRSSADKSKCRTNVTGAIQRNKGRVDSVLGAFKSKNSKLFNDSFGGEGAIID
jgi:hypothetical protein